MSTFVSQPSGSYDSGSRSGLHATGAGDRLVNLLARLGIPVSERVRNYFRRFAWSIVLPAVALTMMGVWAIASAKPDYARKQFLWLLMALAGFVAVTVPHYRRLARFAYPFFGLCFVLLLVTMAMPARGGAHRWIDIGPMRLQPSELTKLAFVAALSRYLCFRENFRGFTGLIMPFALTLAPMGLIVIEPDLGTSLLFLPTLFAMLYAAGARRKHLIGIVLMGVAAMPLFWTVMRDYQKTRVAVLTRQLPDEVRSGIRTVFRLPTDHVLFGSAGADFRFRTNEGHQLTCSLETIRDGELFGVDEDDPSQSHLARLPENHTDFVFAVWAQRTGFAGNLLLLGTFLAMLYAGLRIALTTPDPFGRLMAVGVSTILTVQMLVNVGMTVGLMPITGITLPFVSYGGSSLLSSYVALGVLVNISRRRPFLLSRKAFEFDDE
jgi:cell division protein FtsW (lipid II flippase)